VGYYTNSSSVDQTLIEQYPVCNAGGLNLTAPATVTFPAVTITAYDQTVDEAVTFTTDAETATRNGSQLDITSTQLINAASQTLPIGATTVTNATPVIVGHTGVCSVPTNTVVGYPITLPISPTSAAFFSAQTSTSEGPSDVTLAFAIDVPGGAYTGTYSSTWTVTMASGP
jgi:hypothetical protein